MKDYYNKHNWREGVKFDQWWRDNRMRIERNNLHSFSGLVRNNIGQDYYYTYWAFIYNSIHFKSK